METYSDDPSIRYIEPGEYIDTIFTSLPNGIIDKKATGIGATQLEITDQSRSSIIVCPTKSLAATKAIKHSILYKGSQFPGISSLKADEVRARMARNELIKIMVVADSLPTLLHDLGEESKDYFDITFDEIDSYQLESDYRPALLLSYKEYFKFGREKRRMVSATVQAFSDPELADEQRIIIENYGNHLDDISAIEARSNINSVVVEVINKLRNHQPDKKILIAYNSITEILVVMTLLGLEHEQLIGILCSEESQDRVQGHVAWINNGHLSHPIVFATSAYFVGYDIEEEISIVIVSDANSPYTLISIPRMRQIFGRARSYKNEEGDVISRCLNRVFIFTTRQNLFFPLPEFQNELARKMKFCKEVIALTNSPFAKDIPELTLRNFRQDTASSITHSALAIMQSQDDSLLFNYLIIDYLSIRQSSINQLYTNSAETLTCLAEYYFTELYVSDLSEQDGAEAVVQNVHSGIAPDQWLISHLREIRWSILPNPPAGISSNSKKTAEKVIKMVNTSSSINRQGVIDLFQEICAHSNFSRAISRLSEILELYTKPVDGEMWVAILRQFQKNGVYTGTQIKIGIQRIFAGLNDRSLRPGGTQNHIYTQWLNKVFITRDAGRDQGGRRYRIIDHRWKQLSR